MGRAYLLDGDSNKAIEHFKNALNMNDRLWESHNLIGIAYDRRKEFIKAIEHYKTAILIQPDAASVYNNLGVSYYMSGEYEKAEEAFVAAIEHKETGSKVYNNLALTLGMLGDYSGAYKAFRKAGDEATAKNNMGYLYLRDGKNKEAVQAFEKAIERNPAFYSKAHDNLDAAREAMKDLEGRP
jgi:Flp pilus assembly protein TadD